MSDLNYDPNPYDDVTIDEALAQIYDRVNDRTIRQMVTLLKNTAGDTSRYTIEKATAESGEVTYTLMQQISGGTPTPVGDIVSLRGSQILANYDGELQILDNIISIIKVALDGKQATLTTAQLAAVNSGITSTDVEQIQTNKSNISSNWGAKNLLVNRGSLRKISVDDDIKYTWVNGDVSVTGRKLSEGETYVNVIPVTPLSNLGLSDKVVISNNGTKCFLAVIFWSETLGSSSIYEIVSGSNIIDVPSGYTHIMARLGVKEGVRGTINETIQPMICTKAQWDISHEYQPYPFSNAELTAAERQSEYNILTLQQQVGYANTELEGVL